MPSYPAISLAKARAEGTAEGAALHGFTHVFKLLFDLLGRVGRRIVARHARAHRALADQRHEIDEKISFRALLECGKAAGMERIEQAAADLVAVGRVLVAAEGREAAVAGDLRRDALLDKGPVELLRVVAVIEKIVVGVRVDQPRADLQTAELHDPVRLLRDLAAHGEDAIVLDQNVARKGLCAAAVDDRAVFEQSFHCRSSFPFGLGLNKMIIYHGGGADNTLSTQSKKLRIPEKGCGVLPSLFTFRSSCGSRSSSDAPR